MATVNLGRVVGKSAYELWLDAGNEGSMEDFIASLKGEVGEVTTAQMDAAIGAAVEPVASQLAEIENAVDLSMVNLVDTQTLASKVEDAAGTASTGHTWDTEKNCVVTTISLAYHGRRLLAGQKIDVVEGEVYTLSADVMYGPGATSARLAIGLENQYTTPDVGASALSDWVRVSYTVTIDAVTAALSKARVVIQPQNEGAKPLYIKNIQLQRGDTATQYVPYGTKKSDTIENISRRINALEIQALEVGNLQKSEKGFVYVGNNAPVSYQDGDMSTGEASITCGEGIVFRGYGNYTIALNQADILAALPSNAVAYGVKGYTITLSNNRALCVNTTSKTLVIRVPTVIQSDDYPILFNGWSNLSGVLVQKYLMQSNEATISRLAALESKGALGALSGSELEAVKRYAGKFTNSTSTSDAFLWFTDPHLFEGDNYETEMLNRMSAIEKVYNNTPVSFAVCGGDWIGNSDLQDAASYKLGRIDAMMRKAFGRYYPCVGNHDTNEQGKLTAESANWTGVVTEQTLKNLWNRDRAANYYFFKGADANFYVLDTFREDQTMNAYRWGQIEWLATKLRDDDASNSAIIMHIIFINSENALGAFASNVVSLVAAYNAHASVTLNGTEYSFSTCAGKVRFMLGGHVHRDVDLTVNGVPMVTTLNVRAIAGATSLPTFDLAYADWADGKLHLCRIGSGSDRVIDMA